MIENYDPYEFICTWLIFINKNPHNNNNGLVWFFFVKGFPKTYLRGQRH